MNLPATSCESLENKEMTKIKNAVMNKFEKN